MRERLRDSARLEHIIVAINNIQEFIEGKTQEDLERNKMLFFAIVKNIEIIGEAANNLTKDLRVMHPEVDWEGMTSMRHVLVHDYYQINPRIAWMTATKNIPEIKVQIQNILDEEPSNTGLNHKK